MFPLRRGDVSGSRADYFNIYLFYIHFLSLALVLFGVLRCCRLARTRPPSIVSTHWVGLGSVFWFLFSYLFLPHAIFFNRPKLAWISSRWRAVNREVYFVGIIYHFFSISALG